MVAKRVGLIVGVLVLASAAVYVAGNAGTWLGLSVAPSAPPRILNGEPIIGVPYRVTVYTHCGLRHVEFDHSDWAISGDLGDGVNPPPGFGNPVDQGTVTLTTHETATYRSEMGVERKLTRGGGLPWVQGCA